MKKYNRHKMVERSKSIYVRGILLQGLDIPITCEEDYNHIYMTSYTLYKVFKYKVSAEKIIEIVDRYKAYRQTIKK